MGALHRVLTLLLEERAPISNLTRILESLANNAATIKDVGELTERVRVDIGRTVCDQFRDEQLPKTGTGKIRKMLLKAPFWAGKEKRVQG